MAARALLGLWFIYSGGVKILVTGLDRFTRDIANYQLVGPPFDAFAAVATAGNVELMDPRPADTHAKHQNQPGQGEDGAAEQDS